MNTIELRPCGDINTLALKEKTLLWICQVFCQLTQLSPWRKGYDAFLIQSPLTPASFLPSCFLGGLLASQAQQSADKKIVMAAMEVCIILLMCQTLDHRLSCELTKRRPLVSTRITELMVKHI